MSSYLKKCTLGDLELLREVSIETFTDTFAAQNKPENIAAYLERANAPEQLTKELRDEHSTFYFLMVEENVVGYLKVNEEESALEVERIYIRKAFKRRGFGTQLIQKAESIAQEKGKTMIWLGVWEFNPNAIAFYEQLGFVRDGAHSFFMGDEEQTDFIMKKTL